ncbi:MAG: hypothetical protein Ct9H90mP24_5900 [Methanobacteriota archaeon]|nr:MAG: hypothetical protein Ct9H90mP24_5900 [Euryarchaeota archaeon]
MLGMGLRDFSGAASAHLLRHSTDISQDYRRDPIGWMDIVKKIRRRLEYSLERIKSIQGLECQAPGGAFYLFVKITDPVHSADDKRFVLDLLHEKHVLLVHGSGFSPEMGKGHFRMVCPP